MTISLGRNEKIKEMIEFLKFIREKEKERIIKEGTPEFFYMEDGKMFPRKDFKVKLNKAVEKKFTPYILHVGEDAEFKTKHYGKEVHLKGTVLNAYWKNINLFIRVYDILAQDGKQYRVITDTERYPDDDIMKL